MNRAWICGIIMAVTAAMSVISLHILEDSTERVIGLIDEVIASAKAGDASETERALDEFDSYWKEYGSTLSCLVQTTALGDVSCAAAKLRALYEAGADDLIAECEGIRSAAELIISSQEPKLQSIL
ncbi:protein of unknown function [Ruminococcaceae bacterium FB2012]|nr:protein of unknown function [Ruminococcaceae bacterium FB2012]